MGATKRTNYTEQQLQIADLFKALGHPARIAIIENLLADELLKCKDLQARIPLAQSTISQHLKELYRNGIIGYEQNYNCAYYKINDSAITLVREYLDKIKHTLDQSHRNLIDTYFRTGLFHLSELQLRI